MISDQHHDGHDGRSGPGVGASERRGQRLRSSVRSRLGVPEPVLDAEGYDLKPDPLAAKTAVELVTALREYRVWVGSPSFRRMAARAHHMVAYSTMWNALHGDELPKFDVVVAIIQGCGGSRDDLRAFATAHRRINLGKLG